MAKYVGARGFAWLAYTYADSSRTVDHGDTAVTSRWVLDQPHVFTALGSLTLGRGWRIGARVRMASGSPFTPLIGRTREADGDYVPVFGETFSKRLRTFFQVDVRVDRDWKRPWGTITAFIDVQNATGQQNIEGGVYTDDFSGFEPTTGMPVFPSFGIAYAPASPRQ